MKNKILISAVSLAALMQPAVAGSMASVGQFSVPQELGVKSGDQFSRALELYRGGLYSEARKLFGTVYPRSGSIEKAGVTVRLIMGKVFSSRVFNVQPRARMNRDHAVKAVKFFKHLSAFIGSKRS